MNWEVRQMGLTSSQNLLVRVAIFPSKFPGGPHSMKEEDNVKRSSLQKAQTLECTERGSFNDTAYSTPKPLQRNWLGLLFLPFLDILGVILYFTRSLGLLCVCVLHFILRENNSIGRKIVLYQFCIKDKYRGFHALQIFSRGLWEPLKSLVCMWGIPWCMTDTLTYTHLYIYPCIYRSDAITRYRVTSVSEMKPLSSILFCVCMQTYYHAKLKTAPNQ